MIKFPHFTINPKMIDFTVQAIITPDPSIMNMDSFGNRRWYNQRNKLHRTDGPAVVWSDGSEEYRIHGTVHRIDGPAKIWSDGTEEYWEFGKRIK